MVDIVGFIRESNKIEGIKRSPTQKEINAHLRFLESKEIKIETLQEFVEKIAPGKPLRNKPGMNVRVGAHYPIEGGPQVEEHLYELLKQMPNLSPHDLHCRYEVLHPFMDGNGRSGRVLWLWKMGGIYQAPLGFLHHFYYQTLSAYRK